MSPQCAGAADGAQMVAHVRNAAVCSGPFTLPGSGREIALLLLLLLFRHSAKSLNAQEERLTTSP